MYFLNIRLNFTSSMPIGFYIKSQAQTVHIGDTVAACLPKPIAKLGRKRGYLGPGICPGNVTPVFKEVIALPGETVTINKHFIVVSNGLENRFHIAPHFKYDHNHLPVASMVKLNTPFKATGFMLYGEHNPAESWDSRYFGPIAKTNIIGVYKPLLTTPKPRYLL